MVRSHFQFTVSATSHRYQEINNSETVPPSQSMENLDYILISVII
jgi:hypothetical protein